MTNAQNYSVTFTARDERPAMWDEARLGSRFFVTGQSPDGVAMYCWVRAPNIAPGGGPPTGAAPILMAIGTLYPGSGGFQLNFEPADFDPSGRFPGIKPLDIDETPVASGRPVTGPSSDPPFRG